MLPPDIASLIHGLGYVTSPLSIIHVYILIAIPSFTGQKDLQVLILLSVGYYSQFWIRV